MDAKRKRILVAGHICIDITPALDGQNTDKIGDLFVPGKLIIVGAPDIHLGGAVANTGLAMHIFGTDVCLCGKVGSDDLGQMVARQIAAYKCKARLIEDSDSATSYSVVIAPHGLDRIFLHHPGANDTFCSRDIPDEILKDVDHFHFGYPPLMKRMYENRGDQLVNLLDRMKAKGITTSLDMAAVDPGAPAGQADWTEILTRVLPLVDFFVPSIEETGYMVNREQYNAWNERAAGGDVTDVISVERDAAPLAQRLVDMGARVVILKCGKQGICYHTAGHAALEGICEKYSLNRTSWVNADGFVPAFPPDRILSATGAGDVSIAAFISAMLKGKNLLDCVQLAAAAGSCSVAAYNSLSALASLEELEGRICKGWTNVSERN